MISNWNEIIVAGNIERRKCSIIIRYSEEIERNILCWDTVTEKELSNVSDLMTGRIGEAIKDEEETKLIRSLEYGSQL